MSEPIELGPWPLGINNVDAPQSAVFQPSMQPGSKPAFLRRADNLDLDRAGNYQRRQGRTLRRVLVDAHSAVALAGMCLLVDNGNLMRVWPLDGAAEVLVAGIGNSPVSYAEMNGEVFWVNDRAVGRIVDGTATFWGLPSCTAPLLTLTSGSLRAGTYMVATTCERDGIESGCTATSSISVPDGGGFVVTPQSGDVTADTWNVYVTETNGRELFWAQSVPAGGTLRVSSVSVSTDLLDSFNIYPPPLGGLVFRVGGYLVVGTESGFYWSQPMAPHRFAMATDFQATASKPIMGVAVDGGFYLAVANGDTLWVAGDDPATWKPTIVDTAAVAEGMALVLPARKLPWLQMDSDLPVAVWATADGPAVGLPGGTVRHPTDGRVAMDTNAKATLAYREQDGLRQVLLSLRDKTANSQLGMADHATVTVIKGGKIL